MDEETAAAFLLMQETEACESDTINEEFNTHLTAALLMTGANIGRLLRNERRNTTRNYLCRPQLQPNPRTGTAWQVLFNSQHQENVKLLIVAYFYLFLLNFEIKQD